MNTKSLVRIPAVGLLLWLGSALPLAGQVLEARARIDGMT